MQSRDVQRAQANQVPPVERSGLHLDTVVGVNADGDVMLDRFTNDQGVGQFFSCLNHTAPIIGDNVIYGYVDDAPFVLGKMPDFNQHWRVPARGLRDTFDYDDFEGYIISGASLFSKFYWVLSSTANSVFVTPTAAFPEHPGEIDMNINTAGVVGNYSVMYAGALTWAMANYHQFEWMVWASNVTNGVCQCLAGLTDHSVNFTNCFLFTNQYNATTGANRWVALCNIGGVGQYTLDLGIDFISTHYYILNVRNLDGVRWVATIVNTTNGDMSVQPIKFVPTVYMVPVMRNYQLAASALTKDYIVDYFAWSKRDLAR